MNDQAGGSMAMLELLWTWTPYLLGGFAENLRIAVSASLIGTLLGAMLGLLTLSRFRWMRWPAGLGSNLVRGLPTLVLLFYVATMMPSTLTLPVGGVTLSIPLWFKAAIALAGSPLALTIWNLQASAEAWRDGDQQRALLFLPNWMNSFTITLLTTSIASLIGVDELVSRANTVISVTGHHAMIPVYLYASLFFLAASLLLSVLIDQLRRLLRRRAGD